MQINNKIFGISLEKLMKDQINFYPELNDIKIPVVIKKAIDFILIYGIIIF